MSPARLDVLVTGATGGVGRFVTDEVMRHGHRAIAFSRSASRVFDRSPSLLPVDGAVDDADRVREVMRAHGVSRVIHVAADLSGGRSVSAAHWREAGFDPWSVPRAVATNTLGTANLCAASAELGVDRFVLMSSKGVYGDMPRSRQGGPYPAEHDLPLRPESAYGLTKLMAEQVVEHFVTHYGLDAVVVRASTTVGPETETRRRTGATNEILAGVLSGRDVEVAEGADAVDDFVYLGDLGRGLVEICLAERVPRRLYHMSAGVPLTLHDLAGAARSVTSGDSKVVIGAGADFLHLNHNNHAVLDSTALQHDFGIRARPPAEWIRDFAEAQGLGEQLRAEGEPRSADG